MHRHARTLLLLLLGTASALRALQTPPTVAGVRLRRAVGGRGAAALQLAEPQIESPFDTDGAGADDGKRALSGPLPLTMENVELVLDEMRPYLMADGGNVAVKEIDGPVVRLELQGACGSCPSSAMTMKMGLERGLREKIPEITDVEQVMPDGPQLTEEAVDEVLEEIRPFLKMAGGNVELVELQTSGVAPAAKLLITGSGSTINSVRVEIAQRLKRNFPTLANVTWD